MARSKKDDAAPPQAGHNSGKTPLSKEDRAALLQHHIGKLRAQQAEIEKLKGPYDAAKSSFTDLINGAKSDLGKAYTRKRLTALLEDVGARMRDLAREEEQRFQDRVALGLPVFGVQQDLFGGAGETLPQEAKDEIAWEADGYLAGRRVDARAAPEGCPPRMDQCWLKGYDRGQEETAKLFTRASEIAQPAVEAEPEEPEPEFDADAEARKLKRSGFLDTTEAEAEAEMAAA